MLLYSGPTLSLSGTLSPLRHSHDGAIAHGRPGALSPESVRSVDMQDTPAGAP
jgi:hypothetical protein